MTLRAAVVIPTTLVGSLVWMPCHAAPAVGSFYAHAGLGYTTQSLGDVNDDIRLARSELQVEQANGFVSSFRWEPFGGAASFDAELGYRFTELLAGGIGFAYQQSSVEHSTVYDYFDSGTGQYFVGTYDEKPQVSVWELSGIVTVWVPSAPGLHLGGSLGLARGTSKLDDAIDVVYGTPDGFTTGTGSGEWHATGVAIGAFAGYEVSLAPRVALLWRLGYRYQNVGKMEGSYTAVGADENGPIFGTSYDQPSDASGNPMDFDFSGLYVRMGLGVSFGGLP